MKLQFDVVFKRGTKEVARISGMENNRQILTLTIEDVYNKVLETEQFLEKLTGYRVHIEQVL